MINFVAISFLIKLAIFLISSPESNGKHGKEGRGKDQLEAGFMDVMNKLA